MRSFEMPRLLATLAFVALAALPAHAESPRVVLKAVSVGLPPGAQPQGRTEPYNSIVKFATWAPVYFDLEVKEPIAEPVELVIETPDGDEVRTTLTLPLPSLANAEAGQSFAMRSFPVKPYVRIASGASDTVMRIRTTSGTEVAEPFRIRNLVPTSARTYVVLSLGSALPGFDLPREPSSEGVPAFRNGRVEAAAISDFEDLPDRWFGYDAADLVVIATGSATGEFLTRLFGDGGPPTDRLKRAALLEWIRRGGRVVISAGVNLPLLARFPAFRETLPMALAAEPILSMPGLFFRWKSAGGAPQIANLTSTAGALQVANLMARPEAFARVLLEDRTSGDALVRPVAVQSTVGLGRVTFLALDLDLPPFMDYKLRPEFWDWILRECGSPLSSTGPEGKALATPGLTDEEDELAAALRMHVDRFAEVPVISFGWIAFFLALYVLLIGPVEYWLLKRILGRLEWTWLTFPLIVLTVCVAAYVTAVAFKGHAVRVNKVDVVDVDGASGRVYGQSWFTVFSPRMETYTVTISPTAGWTNQPANEVAQDTLTGWLSGARGGRASLLRRGYRYHVNADATRYADALEDVPIQVWSTKSFGARWSANLDPNSPAIESKLTHPAGDPSQVVGSIVSRLPLGELQDVVVIYAGQAYPTVIGSLAPGVERQLVLHEKPSNNWLAADAEAADRMLGVAANTATRANSDASLNEPSGFPFLSLLFHEAALRKDQGVTPKNASLRNLDQSWRLSPENRGEVIVLGRLAPTTGPAEEALGSPHSPTELWLKGMPGQPRTPLTGAGRQETFVRLYFPVK